MDESTKEVTDEVIEEITDDAMEEITNESGEDTIDETMEKIWEKLIVLNENKRNMLLRIGEDRYALRQLGMQLEESLKGLDVVTTAIQALVAELEEKHNIPKGSDYSLDLDKREIIYGSVPNRSDD